MPHSARGVVLILAFATAGCGEQPPAAPSGDCAPMYTMKGDSEATLELYGPMGEDVEDITLDSSRCNSGVRVTVTHDDERAQLLVPPNSTCVSRTSGSHTDEVSFLYKKSCACAAPWDWLISDTAPPVKIKVEIRPVSSGCAGG